ncbi:MAG: SGNH/GDSL hydrolase family protein [Candidatus Coatesbacteria bacterium]|nr:SGNH/GDSL hydrolase family protein [Candidatus Coatesbacteria bacterium]
MSKPFHSLRVKTMNYLLFAFSLCLSILAAELVIHHLENRNAPVSPRLFYEYDPLLGWSKIPNEEGLYIRPEYEVHEKINSKGLRGPEIPYEKPDGEFRILFLGDSFTEGYAVSDKDHFITKVQSSINSCDAPTRFLAINAGTGAYGIDQELLFWENEGIKYSPDLVVLMFYHNDVWESSEDKHGDALRWGKPRFELHNGVLTLTNVPVPRYTLKRADSNHARSENLTLKQWLNRNSRIYSFLRSRLKRISWLNSAAIALGLAQKPCKKAGRPGYLPLPKRLWIFQSNRPREADEAWMLIEALLERLQKGVKMSGSDLLVFYIPYKAAIYTDELEAARGIYDFGDTELDLDRPGRDLRRICEKLSISYIDSTDAFRARAAALKEKNERLYYVRDGHWNAQGNDLAADILTACIKRVAISPQAGVSGAALQSEQQMENPMPYHQVK